MGKLFNELKRRNVVRVGVAYIVLGALFGPSALGLVSDPELIRSISEFGIMFLLFLLGLNLQPQELLRMVRKTTLVTLLSSLLFFAVGCTVSLAFGFSVMEALLVGGAATFSSTIIGLKLLPTTILHHQRTGEVIISILLLQDLVAIVLLLVVQGSSQGDVQVLDLVKLLVALFPFFFDVILLPARWVLGFYVVVDNLLPLLMTATMVVQTRMTPTGQVQGQMAMMNTMMPLIMIFIFYNMPSGLVLYWLVNTILQVYQTWKIHQTAPTPGGAKA